MDLTILSSRIFTGDPLRPWAEAVCIHDNRIAAVGTNEEITHISRENAHILKLPGKLVTPGFVDAHTHFLTYGLTLQWVNLHALTSLEACRKKIKQAVDAAQPGEWILGQGWNHLLWKEGREPSRFDLDDIAPRNPVMMMRVCTHSIWVNSLALERAAITRLTPNPAGGKIDRDPFNGEPTGVIREAQSLIQDHIPSASLEKRKQAALKAQQELVHLGITGVHSMEGLEQWEALAELEREAQLKLRVYHLLPPHDIERAVARGIKARQGSDRLWFGHVKLFADGSLGSDTALLHEPYLHKPQEYGIACLTPEELRQNVEFAYRFGYDVAIHAIGDKAVTNALDAIEAARTTHPGEHRDRIEHAQLVRPQDFARFHALGITASLQPCFVSSDWQMALQKWGWERCRNAYAFKTFLRHGVPLQFSSDIPVESPNPLLGIYAAVTRQTLNGEPRGGWMPEQKLSLENALTGYTSQHARISRREQSLGFIAPGKWADLTIFQHNLFELPPEEWTSIDVEMTIINGEIVYQRS